MTPLPPDAVVRPYCTRASASEALTIMDPGSGT